MVDGWWLIIIIIIIININEIHPAVSEASRTVASHVEWLFTRVCFQAFLEGRHWRCREDVGGQLVPLYSTCSSWIRGRFNAITLSTKRVPFRILRYVIIVTLVTRSVWESSLNCGRGRGRGNDAIAICGLRGKYGYTKVIYVTSNK